MLQGAKENFILLVPALQFLFKVMDASWLTPPWKQLFEGEQSTDGGLGFPQGQLRLEKQS